MDSSVAHRALAVTHVVVAVLVLPMCAFFGLPLAPLLLAGPTWLVVLGTRLWNPSARTWAQVRRTHAGGLVLGVLFVLLGVHALRAAARSAAEGGGLLGAVGLVPLGIGGALVCLAIASLALASRDGRVRPRRE